MNFESTNSGAEPKRGKPTEAELRGCEEPDPLKDILREMFQLSKTGGQNSSRFAQLRSALKAERIRQIDETFAIMNMNHHSFEDLKEAQSVESVLEATILAAVDRTDLTVPEALSLRKLLVGNIIDLRRSSLAEKERIQQGQQSHRRRASSRGKSETPGFGAI